MERTFRNLIYAALVSTIDQSVDKVYVLLQISEVEEPKAA